MLDLSSAGLIDESTRHAYHLCSMSCKLNRVPHPRRSRILRRSGKGFTIIELLVVIAIIAVLSGLLLPGIIKAKKRASRTECQSQLRQLTIALFAYADDHDFKLPVISDPPVAQWAGSIAPYVDAEWANEFDPALPPDQRRAFFCPVAYRNHEGEVDTLAHGSYGMNDALDEKNVTTVERDVVLLADGQWNKPYWNSGIEFGGTMPTDDDAVHSDGANFSFTDGRVEWVAEEQFTAENELWDPDS